MAPWAPRRSFARLLAASATERAVQNHSTRACVPLREPPSLVLVLEGDGHIELNAGSRKQHASKGAVFFVSAGAQTNVTAGPSGMRLSRCHTNQKPEYN